jgi:hypothetical protein
MKYLIVALFLAGCESCNEPKYAWRSVCDPILQKDVMLGCLERAKHPDLASAAANDAAEVVEECSDAAAAVACQYTRYCYNNCPGDK